MKKRFQLKQLLFLAICCDLGLIAKRLIGPAANLITDALRIPGGVGTSFSVMFVVIAAALTPRFGSGTLVGGVQGLLALVTGRIGSMGALSPVGYLVPGIVADCSLFLAARAGLGQTESICLSCCLSSVSAALTAHFIVFRLTGSALLLYLSVSALTGFVCGLLGAKVAGTLSRFLNIKSGSDHP